MGGTQYRHQCAMICYFRVESFPASVAQIVLKISQNMSIIAANLSTLVYSSFIAVVLILFKNSY